MRKSNNLIVLLVLICGIALLAQNLGLISISWVAVWPIFPLAYGLYLFYQFYKTRNKDLITFATILTGAGAVFLLNAIPNGLTWPETIPWWPIFPLLWGLGALFTYLADKKDISLLLTSAILVCAGVFFLFSGAPQAQGYLKFWPVILITFCIVILLYNAVNTGRRRSEY
ncbi:MAG TPA: hypothetical protein VHT96_14000 [Clostridia bacterium]|nr:hypothetical protein [Clostridia bacterium]